MRLYDAKTLHYSAKIEECGRDPKVLHKITDKLLKNNQQRLQANIEEQHLPAEFMSHFDNKIKNNRDKLNSEIPTTTNQQLQDEQSIYVLEPATAEEIRRIIMKSPNKSCELDPIPTWLLKCCLTELLPLITTLVNKSLATGSFPESFKLALIKPYLKKQTLDPDLLKNYRPVSNLHF